MVKTDCLRTALFAALFGVLGGCGVDGQSNRAEQAARAATRPDAEGPAVGKAGYFPASFFRQRLPRDTTIARDSAEMVRELRNMAFGVDPETSFDCRRAVLTPQPQWTPEEQANCAQVTTRAGIADDEFAPSVYTVPGNQPRVPVAIDSDAPDLRRIMAKGVPIPEGAQPASGSDRQLIIWQPETDTMWEFWRARQDGDGWHAGYGGRIRNVSESPGHYRDVPDPKRRGSYRERHFWGGPGSSIPNLPGLITLNEFRKGEIRHALVFATWVNRPEAWVYPAQRTDGACHGEYCSQIPQGGRFRLDPDYEISRLEHPVVRMIARAVRDYGMVMNNTTGAGVNFYAEGWRGHESVDPYRGPGGFFTVDPTQVQPTLFMREFPWEHLQMLKRGTACRERGTQCPPPRWWPARRDE